MATYTRPELVLNPPDRNLTVLTSRQRTEGNKRMFQVGNGLLRNEPFIGYSIPKSDLESYIQH